MRGSNAIIDESVILIMCLSADWTRARVVRQWPEPHEEAYAPGKFNRYVLGESHSPLVLWLDQAA